MARQKKGQTVKTFGASLYPSEIKEITEEAERQHWTPAFLGGRLLMLGWAIYQQTGSFAIDQQNAGDAPEPPVTPAHLRPPGNAEFVVDENDVEPVSFRKR